MPRMAVRRVARLVEVLQGVEPGQFYMGAWARDYGNNRKRKFDSGCGSTACAFGHACLDPVLIEQGLSMVMEGPNYEGVRRGTPRYKHWKALDAAKEFFGLSHDMATQWFMPSRYRYEDRDNLKLVTSRIKEDLRKERAKRKKAA